MARQRTGKCLCGKVQFRFDDAGEPVNACHCSHCRRWTSGPLHAVHPKSTPVFDSDETLVWFNSSDWAERGFCSNCGSSLFYRIKGDRPDYIVSAGALDDQSDLTFASEIFIDEKPDYYSFAGERPTMTGAEVFALYAPADEDPS